MEKIGKLAQIVPNSEGVILALERVDINSHRQIYFYEYENDNKICIVLKRYPIWQKYFCCLVNSKIVMVHENNINLI
jgi:hypothetical protein